jgi:hypothetical protein
VTLPKNCRNIPEDWLVYEILALAKCRIDLDNFQGCLVDFLNQHEDMRLLDDRGNKLSIIQFNYQYEKYNKLSRYFRRRQFRIFHSELFRSMQYIGRISVFHCEKLSKTDNIMQFDKPDPNMMVTEIRTSADAISPMDMRLATLEEFFHDHPDRAW